MIIIYMYTYALIPYFLSIRVLWNLRSFVLFRHPCGGYGDLSATDHPTSQLIYKLRARRDGRHFADDIFKCIFLNENMLISINNSLKFVPKGPIINITALVQIMAWRRSGDKPLSEPILVDLQTHICVTRPQWVNAAAQYRTKQWSCMHR